MRWTRDRTAGELSDDGGGGGRTVVVGVKFDSQSRELLTWALVKVAQPGDCVIALHVIDCVCGESRTHTLSLFLFLFLSEFRCVGFDYNYNAKFFLCSVEGTASLLSLVKTFDSVLSVYDGFCSLKQVQFHYHIAVFRFFLSFFLFDSLFGCRENAGA
jgi:hypothetical protein